ncbi:hypothetical protein C8J56DRAFT_785163, partial [Mycena floridula]
CGRYGFMETLETMLLTCAAEIFITLRVYALAKRRRVFLYGASIIIAWPWAIAFYVMSQSSLKHLGIMSSRPFRVPWVEAFLCLSLAFDGLAFIAIIWLSISLMKRQQNQFTDVLGAIRRDGILYFFVLFGSNLVWLLLLLHGRVCLQSQVLKDTQFAKESLHADVS